MPLDRDVDLHAWFDDSELERCPHCQKNAALRAPDGGWIVCTECGAACIVSETRPDSTAPNDAGA